MTNADRISNYIRKGWKGERDWFRKAWLAEAGSVSCVHVMDSTDVDEVSSAAHSGNSLRTRRRTSGPAEARSVDLWEFSCQEFMHHNSFKIPFALAPKDYSVDKANGVFECTIQGANIREPVVQSIPVRFTFVEKDALPIAEDLLCDRTNPFFSSLQDGSLVQPKDEPDHNLQAGTE